MQSSWLWTETNDSFGNYDNFRTTYTRKNVQVLKSDCNTSKPQN